ncbi:MAG: Rab family GTPase [Promethearchaeota archaeon]
MRHLYKILVIGESGVGKTTFLLRFQTGKYVPATSTVGLKPMIIGLRNGYGDVTNLQIWDFGGQEHFRFFQDSFCRGAHGAIIVFDTTDNFSFIKIGGFWLNFVKRNAGCIPVILVGAKIDLFDRRLIYEEDVEPLHQENNEIKKVIFLSSKISPPGVIVSVFQDLVDFIDKEGIKAWTMNR